MSDSLDITPNVTLYDDAGNPVDVILDGSVYRLAVDSNITGGNFQLQPFVPLFDYSVASTATSTGSDTSLHSESGHRGKLDFIAIAGSNSSYEVVIKIDTIEILRIDMGDLGSDLGLANATNVPLWVETANKNFRFSPDEGVDFTNSFELLVKATASPTPTVNWLINHRDEG